MGGPFRMLALVLVPLACVGAATPSTGTPTSPAPSEPTPDPSFQDLLSQAKMVAEQELKALPTGAVQTDCSLGRPTLPPYTRLSGGTEAPSSSWLMADASAFLSRWFPRRARSRSTVHS
jgi:hypothetical protein